MKTITTSVMNVTPAMAREWLAKNIDNRRVRQSHVDYLAGCIIRGEWMVTHQGIAFSPTGRLLDGQHRLLAVIKADKTVKLQVSTAVPESAFDVIDVGNVKRSFGDVLHAPYATTAVATLAMRVMHTNFSSAVATSPQQIRPYVDRLGPLLHDLEVGGGQNGTRLTRNAHIRLAGILAAENGEGMPFVNTLYRNLVKRNYGDLPPVAIAFLRRLDLRDLISAPTNPDMLICARRVFSRKYANNTKLLIRDREPRLKELKQELEYIMGGAVDD